MSKLTKHILLIVLFTLLIINTSFGFEKKELNGKITYAQVEENLLAGLSQDNFGLKISSAYMLGEIKSERAVLPLTQMLRNSDNEKLRLVAALSLLKIGTERSIYVVKDGVRFNESEKVRNLCEHLYNAHIVSIFGKEEPDQQALFSYLLSD